MTTSLTYFLPNQRHWILDPSRLKLMQKSRRIGVSYADAYHSVRIVSVSSTARRRASRLLVYEPR